MKKMVGGKWGKPGGTDSYPLSSCLKSRHSLLSLFQVGFKILGINKKNAWGSRKREKSFRGGIYSRRTESALGCLAVSVVLPIKDYLYGFGGEGTLFEG